MTQSPSYVPILKTKQGEFEALERLTKMDRGNVLPLVDVVRVPPDWKKDGSSKELGEHLKGKARRVGRVWGDRLAFIDLYDIDLSLRVKSGKHPVTFMFEALREQGCRAVPTTGFERDADYNEAVASVVAQESRGFCVRALEEDLLDAVVLGDEIQRLARTVGASLDQTHLILDLRSIAGRDVRRYLPFLRSVLAGLPAIQDLASVTLAASSMPQHLGALIKTGQAATIERVEWALWRALCAEGGLPRLPSFGDYGVVHPDYLDLDPRKITVAPNIRYTTRSGWLVLRGVSLRKRGFEQYHELARRLVEHPEFLSAGDSWGDRYIVENAKRSERPGNLSKWVGVGTNHHLTVVGREVARLS
jgi:hypothetical protein